MPINSQRGKIKPAQAASLLRLAIDKKAVRRDRAWAIDTLVEAKDRMGHEDLAKAAKMLTDKDIRLKPRLKACLLKIAGAPEQRGARARPSLQLRPSS